VPAFPRLLQWLGLAIVVVTAFGTHFELRARPGQPLAQVARGRQEVPAEVLGAALADDLSARGPGLRLWEARRWYPYLLVPFWLVGLAWVALRPRARRPVGVGLLVLTLAVAVLEAFYLAVEYAPLLPDVFGQGEALIAWGIVATVLLWRRAPDRTPDAVEAHVASQAMLGWLHLLTLPATQARCWLDRHQVDDVVCAVGTNFGAAFWWGIAGLALMSLPVYLRPTRAAAPQAAAPPPAPVEQSA
jgi:hypothetical protein